VLNAACSGYSTHQGREILRRRGVRYRPDVVTIWFGWNDSVVWDGMTDAEHARLFAREHLLTLSATYRALSYALRRESHDEVRENRHEARERQRRMPVPDYEARLRDMVELARATEISPGSGRSPAVVFIQGCYIEQMRSARTRDGRVKLDRHQKAMARTAREVDVPMLSVCDALYEAGVGEEVFLDKGHLDPQGLRIVADELFAFLAEQGVLPDPVSREKAG
jgi:lysophospholipase L1-like esterase